MKIMLDDISYIEDIHHYSGKMGLVVWHQYDVLLATRPYGWDTMVKYVAYLAQADIKKVETLTTSDLAGGTDTELIDDYRRSDGDLYRVLAEERGTLGIGGYSDTLKGPVKVVWYNQTRVLRIFVQSDDETLIRRYAETVIRASFGTEDAMKLAKPYLKK